MRALGDGDLTALVEAPPDACRDLDLMNPYQRALHRNPRAPTPFRGAGLVATAAATVLVGVAAEPLLRLAAGAMLSG